MNENAAHGGGRGPVVSGDIHTAARRNGTVRKMFFNSQIGQKDCIGTDGYALPGQTTESILHRTHLISFPDPIVTAAVGLCTYQWVSPV